jgi:mono/diheme cytochrome c family protein
MKKRLVCGSAALVLTGLTFAMFASAGPGARAEEAKLVSSKATTSIDRGRYIVKVAGCNDCHTPGYAQTGGQTDEKQWLTGDSVGWSGAWGVTYPINLRLFAQSVTADQWMTLARQPARPPMPWFALRDMSDADLLAVYEYIRHLGPAGEQAPAYLAPGSKATTPVVAFPQ